MSSNINNKSKEKLLAESISRLVDRRIKGYGKLSMTQKEVVVRRVYNRNNFNKRRVDVVFADEIAQSMPIINIPVNVPYDIVEGDRAYLTYCNDRPESGYISQIITYNGDRDLFADYKIKVVDSLPAEPVSGVLYFIKE